jgi:pimeloyl-ACP methyl ester carboxylesterase
VTVQRIRQGDLYARVNTIGTDGERAFVLVPGIGVSANYFEQLAPRLREFGPVHALDLPGFGGVPHPASAMSIRQYADLLGTVIDGLGLDDPILVGHSMGTQVVVDLAARRPDLSTVVLIGPVINPAERRVGLQALRFLQSSIREPRSVVVLAISAYLFCGVKWFSRVLPVMMRFPMERALPHVTAHTLVIRGEFDAVCPKGWMERVGALLPSSRLREISDSAHSVMYAHASEVAELCVEHASNPPGSEERGVVGEVEAREVAEEDFAPTLGDRVRAARGRIVETVGVLKEDDSLIEAGKSEHAGALRDAHERQVRGEGHEGDEDRDQSSGA